MAARSPGPLRVDPARHHAGEVGDEPLLLARAAPTIVARDRVAGAKLAVAAGASVIVMDDGFQNPSLDKDFVAAGRRRAARHRQRPGHSGRAAARAARWAARARPGAGRDRTPRGGRGASRPRPAARAFRSFRPAWSRTPASVAALGGGRVLAFAGIGDPEKFFATLADAGITVAATRSFPDHHRYTRAEARALRAEADREGSSWSRPRRIWCGLPASRAVAELAARAHALPVTLAFEDETSFRALLLERLAAARRRTAATAQRRHRCNLQVPSSSACPAPG